MSAAELAGRRVLVVGLARSGIGRGRGARRPRRRRRRIRSRRGARRREAPRPRCRSSQGTRGGEAATGDRSRREEPGSPGRDAARRERARARRSRVGRDRARRRGSSRTRSSASPGRTARRPRASSSARSSVPHGRSVEVAGNVGRPLTSLVGSVGRRRMGRLRALLVPARGRAYVEAARRRPPQSRARPPRPPRGPSRRTATRSSGCSSADRGGRRRSPARVRATSPVRRRRVDFAGDDALPAEPVIPGPHNRENASAATAAARAAGIERRRHRRRH